MQERESIWRRESTHERRESKIRRERAHQEERAQEEREHMEETKKGKGKMVNIMAMIDMERREQGRHHNKQGKVREGARGK